jgi:hypothetical protein
LKKPADTETGPLFERITCLAMDISFHLFVEWPNGSRLPVRLPQSATGEDLLNLLNFSCRGDQGITLVFDGVCVNPSVQLCQQHLRQDSTIKVVRVSSPYTRPASPIDDYYEFLLADDSFDAICPELLRLADSQFRIVEGHRNGGQFYRQMLMEQSDTEETESEQPPTVLKPRPDSVSQDPLPPLVGSESDDDELDRFDGFRHADGSIFAAGGARQTWCW